jgi:cobalt-zinc-cadmium resistance protein CzcA
LSLAALEAAIETNNRNDGAGRLNSGEESLLVRSDGNIRTLDDLKAIAITEKQGVAIRVGDVAEVRTGALTRYGVVTRNGQSEAVEGLVLAMRGANARDVVAQVRNRLNAVAPSLPKGMEIQTFYDRGNLVERATGTVISALAEASVLVVILLYVFLGNLRSALVVTCILPLSALSTFILMHYFDCQPI